VDQFVALGGVLLGACLAFGQQALFQRRDRAERERDSLRGLVRISSHIARMSVTGSGRSVRDCPPTEAFRQFVLARDGPLPTLTFEPQTQA
jgi:hypothetical protein